MQLLYFTRRVFAVAVHCSDCDTCNRKWAAVSIHHDGKKN
jgi:hypothetical protein